MATVGEVVAALRRALDLLPFAALADAHEAAEDARLLVERAGAGGGQDEFAQLAAWFGAAVEGIADQAALTRIQRTTTAVVNRLEGPGTRPGTPPGRSAPDPPVAAVDPRALLDRLPVRTKADPKTRGIWVDDRGREREPIVSGRDELSSKATEELRRLGISPIRGALTVADHVEVKLAVHLRGTDERHATLIVNNSPCRTGEFSCNRLLPRILRPGQAVTVYWPGGVKTYAGRTA